MANRVTSDDIIRINESYYKNKTYAAAARETGFSASTVKKYVIPGWEPTKKENIKKFKMEDIPKFDSSLFKNLDNFGELCVLTAEEVEEMKTFWEELSI